MADADKTMSELKAQIKEKDGVILSLRSQLEDALQRIEDIMNGNDNTHEELMQLKQKYEENLEIILNLQMNIK